MKKIIALTCLLTFVPCVYAQDMLPRDNGIYDYHRAPRYRPSESHPLRTLSYVAHPFGWLLREGLYRPFSAFTASTRFTRSFLGFREPFDYRETVCFSNSSRVPDCWGVAPLNSVNISRPSSISNDNDVEVSNGANKQARQSLKASASHVFLPDVAFNFGKSNLSALGRGRIRQVAQRLAEEPSLAVTVEGHTDSVGSENYNARLGEKRALTVIRELSELGIDPARMTAVSYGEGKPIFSENTDWANAVNRRVHITIE